MADGVKIKVEGIEKANRNLKQLEYKVRKKVIRKAVREGSKVALKAIRAEVPKETGALGRSFHVKVDVDRRTGSVTGQAKQNRKRKATKSDRGNMPSRYLHLVVLGSSPHEIRPRARALVIADNVLRAGASHPGAKANDFVGRAARRSERQSLQRFTVVYGEGVTQAVKELPK